MLRPHENFSRGLELKFKYSFSTCFTFALFLYIFYMPYTEHCFCSVNKFIIYIMVAHLLQEVGYQTDRREIGNSPTPQLSVKLWYPVDSLQPIIACATLQGHSTSGSLDLHQDKLQVVCAASSSSQTDAKKLMQLLIPES